MVKDLNVQEGRQGAAWNPLTHFVLAPLFLFCLVASIAGVVQSLGHLPMWRVVLVLLSLGGLLGAVLQRWYALRVQDRVIRLEERLRIAALASAAEAHRLTTAQLIALRFASDEELPMLVTHTLNEDLTPEQIKMRVERWRPDLARI